MQAHTRTRTSVRTRPVLDTLSIDAYATACADNAVHETAPGLEGVVRGNPNAPPFSFPGAFVDSSSTVKVLQLKPFRSLGECAVDTYKSIKAKL